MKSMIAGALVCLAVATAFGGDYREFSDMQGRVIKAKIVEFDSVKGKLLIEREGGKQVWVRPSVFSEPDQDYIKEWFAAEQVLSEKNLRITLKKQNDAVHEKESDRDCAFDGEALRFEVTLENRTEDPIENLKIKYRIFIAVEDKTVDGEDYTRPVSGELVVEHIAAASSVAVLTESATYGKRTGTIEVVYSNKKTRITDTEEKVISDEELIGIWLKVIGPEIGGEAVVRDVCFPESLMKKVEWGEDLSSRVEQALQRGPAAGRIEFDRRMSECFEELLDVSDAEQLREISNMSEVLYDSILDPSGTWAANIAVGLYHKGLYDLAANWMNRPAEGLPNPVFRTWVLAELYASAPVVCDGSKAVAQVQTGLERSEGRELDAWKLNVMACAYARDGQFEKAVQYQEQALAKLDEYYKKRYQESFERRLKLYQAGTPYDLDVTDPLCWCYNVKILKRAGTGQDQSEDQGAQPNEYLWPENNPCMHKWWYSWRR